jgi:hypothetical protein
MMSKATTVYEAAAVCDPDLALDADDDRYVDLSPHRGTNVVQQLYRAIRVKEEAVAKGDHIQGSGVRQAPADWPARGRKDDGTEPAGRPPQE